MLSSLYGMLSSAVPEAVKNMAFGEGDSLSELDLGPKTQTSGASSSSARTKARDEPEIKGEVQTQLPVAATKSADVERQVPSNPNATPHTTPGAGKTMPDPRLPSIPTPIVTKTAEEKQEEDATQRSNSTSNLSFAVSPLEHLPCANYDFKKGWTCTNRGSSACSVCHLVSYCSRVCGRIFFSTLGIRFDTTTLHSRHVKNNTGLRINGVCTSQGHFRGQ